MNGHINETMRGVLAQFAPHVQTGTLSDSEYFAHPGITKSAICAARLDAETVSMAAMRLAMLRDRTDDSDATPSMRWGTLAHAVLLEPVAFARRLAVWSEPKRGNAWAAFKMEAEADGRRIVSDGELQGLNAMRDAFQADRDAAWILAQCQRTECPLFWTDADYVTGKGRLDGWGRDTVLEYKTGRSILKRAFRNAATSAGYHLGVAWYWHGAGRPQHVYFINQMNVPPYSVASYEVPHSILQSAYEEARAIAVRYRMAERVGEFPGPYSGIQTFELPAWAADGGEVDVSTGTMEGGEL